MLRKLVLLPMEVEAMNRKQLLSWISGTALLGSFVALRTPEIWSIAHYHHGCGPRPQRVHQESMVRLIGEQIADRLQQNSPGETLDLEEVLSRLKTSFPFLIYCQPHEGGFLLGTIGPDGIAATEDDYFQYWLPNDRYESNESFSIQE